MRSGFTLIEALVALAVTSTVLALAATAVRQVAGYEARAKGGIEEARRVEGLRRALSTELKGLVTAGSGPPLRLDHVDVAGRTTGRIEMLTANGLLRDAGSERTEESARPRVRSVAYTCQQDGGALSLVRTESAPGDSSGVGVRIMSGLEAFEAEAVKAAGEAERNGGGRVAPDLVRFRAKFQGGGMHSFVCGLYANTRLAGGDGEPKAK